MILLSGKNRRDETRNRILSFRKENEERLAGFSFYFFSDKEDFGSEVYIRSLKKILSSFSIPYKEDFYDRGLSDEENIAVVRKHSNRQPTRIFRPLPTKHEKAFLSSLYPSFDPDRLCLENRGRLLSGDRDYLPATVKSIQAILKHYSIPLEGKKALVLGRSVSLGLPCQLRLRKENMTVTVAHSFTDEATRRQLIKESDLIVLSSGKKGLVQKEDLSPDKVIIDCGFSRRGELGFIPDVYAYTPVPGGVGSLTPYYLIWNALKEYIEKAQAD